jgi:Na+/H+ antiporter NhaD/arsenite permease-like protein
MTSAAVIFVLTYLVIGIQRFPKLHIGRPAGALLGACAMVAFGVVGFDEAKSAIDLDTILFLLGMMIVLGYLHLSGFFELVERRVLGWASSGRQLLALVVVSSGVLSALFMNDTICLMLTPLVIRVTRRIGLPPAPYLIGLAVASNCGSVCTVMGNPQNALIGVRSGISLVPFAAGLWPVSAAALAIAYGILAWRYRREITSAPLAVPPPRVPPSVQRWMLGSSLAAGVGMVAALSLGAPPGGAAMGAAAAVILAGSTRPREALRHVDWSLLLFFGGLFVVMRGVSDAGIAGAIVSRIAGPLHAVTAVTLARVGAGVTVLSQLVSNVPAVMLFMPDLAAIPAGSAHRVWLALAAFSTLAGNLTVIGSVANVIVFESAAREGIEIGFGEYVRVGIPLTVGSLVAAWAWLARP